MLEHLPLREQTTAEGEQSGQCACTLGQLIDQETQEQELFEVMKLGQCYRKGCILRLQ